MLRIWICDDLADQRKMIRDAAEDYLRRSGYCADFRIFCNAMEFMESLDHDGGCEIALLDICMPGISGTEIAKEIRQRGDATEIIFLTTSEEYAVQAFSLKAAHYLVKPFTQAQFDEAMARASEHLQKDGDRYLNARGEGGEMHRLKLDEVQYIESFRHSQEVHLTDGSILKMRFSLSSVLLEAEHLSPGQFFSPYKGYIVNMKAVESIDSKRMILRCGAEIPIPRGTYREIKDKFFDYMFNRKM